MKTIIKILLTLCLVAASPFLTELRAEQNYEIQVMTPEVKAALNNRKARFEQLRVLKANGSIGENNRGYIEMLSYNEGNKPLIDAENEDRKMIYQTIEQQNNLSNAMGTIEKVFAQVQRDKAATGEKIQLETGEWTTK